MLRSGQALCATARRLAVDPRGSTAIEYGLIAALICIAILTGLTGTNASVTEAYRNVMERVSEALNNGG